MSELLISYYEHPALSNAGGRRHGRRGHQFLDLVFGDCK